MITYKVKLVNEEVLTIEADGYDISHRGTIAHFYVAPDGINSKEVKYRIPVQSILYIEIDYTEISNPDPAFSPKEIKG